MPKLKFTKNKWSDMAIGNITIRSLFTLFCADDNVVPLLYECGTIHGIYNQTADGKDIIAIDNDTPHNGEFDKFIAELEQYAKKTGERIAICAFMNERLYRHMRKRPGWGNVMSTMDRLEFYP